MENDEGDMNDNAVDVHLVSVITDPSIVERNKALSELDMEWARRKMPEATNDHIRLLAMHKSRYECLHIDAQLRHDSGKWLKENGYKRMFGMELLPEGELPE